MVRSSAVRPDDADWQPQPWSPHVLFGRNQLLSDRGDLRGREGRSVGHAIWL